MFYAFSRFNKPRDFGAARSAVLAWVKQATHFCYLEAGEAAFPASYTLRPLTAAEVLLLENFIDSAWQQSSFGGYARMLEPEGVSGCCYFELDEPQLRARLVGLISDSAEPLGAVVLNLGLTDLLREIAHLEEIYLPFAATGPEGQTLLAGHDLEPGSQPGWWKVVYETSEERPNSLTPASSVKATPATWLELAVLAEPEAVEAVTELFARYGYNQGVVIEEAIQPGPDGGAVVEAGAHVTIRTYVSSDSDTKNLEKLREGLFYLGRLLHIEPLQVVERREEDWANAWKEFYQVHRVGWRTVIKPPWQEYTSLPDDIVVEIDPGMAFGTGLHPTTRLCLQIMEERLNPLEHPKILDLGTGSGILAIAAARLNTGYVLGVDTDSVAVRAARENVERNGLSQQIVMETGSLAVEPNPAAEGGFYAFPASSQQPPGELSRARPFDAIIANIIARVLIGLAGPMAEALRPGGLLITSGIIGEKAAEVAAALEGAGLQPVERREETDWVAFAHRKP